MTGKTNRKNMVDIRETADITDAVTGKKGEPTLSDILLRRFGCDITEADRKQIFRAALMCVSETAMLRMKKPSGKRVNYLSMEFLPGRMLRNSLRLLGIEDRIVREIEASGHDPEDVFSIDRDMPLGSGGLGRLAASYAEAMSTLGVDGMGHTLLYRAGYFEQDIDGSGQRELPESGLSDVFDQLIPRRDQTVTVSFYGSMKEKWSDGRMTPECENAIAVRAVPYDLPVPGYGGVSTVIRCWRAEPMIYEGIKLSDVPDADAFAASLTASLYPDDSTEKGKQRRLAQEYFLASAAVKSAVRHHLSEGEDIRKFGDKNVLHINDTHPALAIPELFRILMDVEKLSWEESEEIVKRSFTFTNHTVMPEALGHIGVHLIKSVLPRIYSIVAEMDRRERELWRSMNVSEETAERAAIISGGELRTVNLAALYSRHVNGVSEIHTEILKTRVMKSLTAVMTGDIRNVTNGISHRRWLCLANPGLAALIREYIGDGFAEDPQKLGKLREYAHDREFCRRFLKIRAENKEKLCRYLRDTTGINPDPTAITDVQIKRIHEYKRQLMNALRITAYIIKAESGAELRPKTFVFAGKAAPTYERAKEIIRLILALSDECRTNEAVRGRMSVCFLPDYSVSVAETVIPAADINEQISLAGTEASGTGNMKFMLSGSLTVGTRDGANLEIAHAAGEENMILFGMTREEAERARADRAFLSDAAGDDELFRSVLERLRSGIGGKSFSGLADYLYRDDPFLCMADLKAFMKASEKAENVYYDTEAYAAKCIGCISASGWFSSDRAVAEYRDRIWK